MADMKTALDTCPIWGPDYKATIKQDHPAWLSVINSDRAGGAYEITEEEQVAIQPLANPEKARLTTWLIDQRTHGDEMPRVTSQVISHSKNKRPLPVHQRGHRLLRFIAGLADRVGERVSVDRATLAAYAWSESTAWDEIYFYLKYLDENGWLQGHRSSAGTFHGTVTVYGYSHIADHETNTDSSQAFVAMWFDDSMAGCYENGIEPGIRDAGYEPLRIDRKEHVNKIDDEIIAEIRRSRFLVADFTQGPDGARGGVYYEAGFAHGLDLPVIFTCRQDSLDKLHFDTSHYNHIVWDNHAELRTTLTNRILAVIGEGPEAHRNP